MKYDPGKNGVYWERDSEKKLNIGLMNVAVVS